MPQLWCFDVVQQSFEEVGLISSWKIYLEKYKTGVTGKNFVVEEPEFVFEKPKFAQKINLPLCSEVEVARSYLEQRKIDPSNFTLQKTLMSLLNRFQM